MKLNLGCGAKLLPGFVNVDLAGNWTGNRPDVEADVMQRLPFEDGAADEVHAYHVIEHVERYRVEGVLSDWARVVKPGGMIVLECPCLDKVLAHFRRYIDAGKPIDPQMTMWGLYGDQRYARPEMVHKWCYSINELSALVEDAGLEVRVEEPQTHVRTRDMRIVGVK